MQTKKILERSNTIKEISEVHFDESSEQLQQFFSSSAFQKLKENAEKITVLRILYFADGVLVRGYVVEPKDNKRRLPSIIFNRGGSKSYSSIKIGQLFSYLAELSLEGYIVFASQYMGGPGSEGVDEWGGKDLESVIALREVVTAHPCADEDRIGMVGVSRGGLMTYLALTKVDWIKAAVVISGVSHPPRMRSFRPEMWDMYKKLFDDVEEAVSQRSALNQAENMDEHTPILIMHGAQDEKVAVEDSIEMSEKLDLFARPHKLILYEDGDHFIFRNKREVFEHIKKWFDRYL